jgi:hypothetical protein
MQVASPIPNVTLVERVPDTVLESFLSAGDVWIVPHRKNNTGVSVPSRIYNLFTIGRPIIICSKADAETVIRLREENMAGLHRPTIHKPLLASSSLPHPISRQPRNVDIEQCWLHPAIPGQIALGAYRDLASFWPVGFRPSEMR